MATEGLAGAAVPGRMQRIERGSRSSRSSTTPTNPPLSAALLDALRPQVAGRLLVVLGAGGDRDRAKRR